MTWDRFDDAMKDVDRDRRELAHKIEEAEQRLQALGCALPERPTARATKYDGPQSLYADAVNAELVDNIYLSDLLTAIDKAERSLSGENRDEDEP